MSDPLPSATSAASTAGPAPSAVLAVTNPVNGERVGEVRAVDPDRVSEEVATVVARARRAQKAWGAAPFSHRAAVLRRFHDLVLEEADRVLDTIQQESGKARRDALTEVVTVAGTARYYLAHGEDHLRERRRKAAVPGLTSARVIHKPLGVVGLITPWNFPFILTAGDAVPALLAGNAVVIKPAEITPLSAELARELLVAAGLDPDLFALVHGDGASVGQELIRQVDSVGFTGSTAVGRKVAAAAGERLIPCSLELGGKNPMVVLADAPIDDAVEGLVSGAFANTGQTCICVERVYVERPAWDRFVAAAVERTEGLRLGWSLGDAGWEDDMGSLVSADHADKVWSHIEDARERGARVLAGGTRRGDLGPAFIAPTLLAGVTDEMLPGREETFGPVVCLEPVDRAEDAVDRANATPYGLNASVWGKDRRAFEIARGLETGTANVNSTLLIYNSFDVPMGGVKASGLGRRHGEHGILRHTQEQSLVGSFSTGGGYESLLTRMTTEARARALLGAVKLWRRIPFLR